MSALELEPSALMRSPEEEQGGGYEPGHIFTQLLAAMENPDIKALEWSQDGRDVVVDIELFEEEMGKNKELFPELADLGSGAALQVWLLAYGFRHMGTKVKLQHPSFQRAQPTTEELGTLGGDGDLSAMQQKKKKRKTSASCQRPRKGAKYQGTLGQWPRLRPLYQYINFEMPEHPSAENQVLVVAQPSQVPAVPGTATAPLQQDPWTSSALEIPAPEASDTLDSQVPISIDWMMRCAALQVPFLQYK